MLAVLSHQFILFSTEHKPTGGRRGLLRVDKTENYQPHHTNLHEYTNAPVDQRTGAVRQCQSTFGGQHSLTFATCPSSINILNMLCLYTLLNTNQLGHLKKDEPFSQFLDSMLHLTLYDNLGAFLQVIKLTFFQARTLDAQRETL